MASLAEIRVGLLPPITRLAIEKLIRPLPLREIGGASLEHARELNQESRWKQAAHEFYSVYLQATKPEKRAEAGIVGLPQMLINLAKFGQAREWISKTSDEVMPQIEDENEGLYFEARGNEKLAWIDGYEGDFKKEIERLDQAKQLVEKIPDEKRGKKEEELLSTLTHFSGRARLGLALHGVNKDENVRGAIDYFQEDLAHYRELRKRGESAPAGEGFNHAWLARCYLELDKKAEAEKEIGLAQHFFEEYIKDHSESGVLAHIYLLKGNLAAKRGQVKESRSCFEEALKIRLEIEPYPKGAAEAAVGIAWSYVADGKYGAAMTYLLRALKTYPFFLLRGFI